MNEQPRNHQFVELTRKDGRVHRGRYYEHMIGQSGGPGYECHNSQGSYSIPASYVASWVPANDPCGYDISLPREREA